ncbi:YIF1-domain-containing protein [Suillus cothurnatus]|nr:YIF1-domain-containing protein [Suillus cothurnatus]
MNDTTAQFSMHLGQTAKFAGIIPVTVLKHHSNVSNSYAGYTDWQPPRNDINSTDLYITECVVFFIALVTYILVAALQTGIQERFHPQIFGASAARTLLLVLLDFLFVQCGCYLLNIQGTSQLVDLIAYGGYNVTLTLFTGLLNLGSTIYALIRTVNPASRKRRIMVLFLEAVLHVVYMGTLVRM